MRFQPLALATFALAACGRTSSGGQPAFPTVSVTDANAVTTVSSTGVYDVAVSGSLDLVTIAPNQSVRDIRISGASDELSVGPSTHVSGTITISGSNCIVHLPVGSTIPVRDSGSGNQVLFDSAVAIASRAG
jgi:hypothetical protein